MKQKIFAVHHGVLIIPKDLKLLLQEGVKVSFGIFPGYREPDIFQCAGMVLEVAAYD